ncbi:VOC family protein [Kiloniella majae]|uniref:VOC family protein n=1 Tax=Kiloniella majae TaxID=1938558 RepID=UPI000A278B14|nr:VOC family protein [Kiloniella majae]
MSRPKLVPELLCSDLTVSLDFYLNIIGFKILYDRPENHFAYLEMDGVEIMLDETPETSTDEGDWWTARAT